MLSLTVFPSFLLLSYLFSSFEKGGEQREKRKKQEERGNEKEERSERKREGSFLSFPHFPFKGKGRSTVTDSFESRETSF